MKIKGLEGLTWETLEQEVGQGGKFVVYTFCISIIIMTFRRSSAIYYIAPGMGSVGTGLRFTLISVLFGWWGIPWGPIYTIGALVTNFKGGRDMTVEVLNSLAEQRGPQQQIG
ncbi:hypothetical protein [Paenibacillus jilunlii]|uniref:Uncharacterized protein n=1 Tax=Paenibacillus jilunlii TaxID=682956 RepID=A0A1G9NM76_9BACL|nr:hypothetical protein [Paenibacillus jilunlii]KWX77093.1 hypothetical protein AML91_08590 [Paenibacillus jilunlii]SDL87480.1 hypothetical protein SAMN05216191_106248 [Paenibacillus jilunlii]